MALTKSLHTITAVTRVAQRELQVIETWANGEELAREALLVLGYDIDTRVKGDPTVDRIVVNCDKLIADMKEGQIKAVA